jgi:hypothetical protein
MNKLQIAVEEKLQSDFGKFFPLNDDLWDEAVAEILALLPKHNLEERYMAGDLVSWDEMDWQSLLVECLTYNIGTIRFAEAKPDPRTELTGKLRAALAAKRVAEQLPLIQSFRKVVKEEYVKASMDRLTDWFKSVSCTVDGAALTGIMAELKTMFEAGQNVSQPFSS